MATTVAQLEAIVDANTGPAERNLASFKEKADSASGGIKGFVKNVLTIASGIGVAQLAADAFGFLKDNLSDLMQQAEESQSVYADTVAAIKSTKGAAGLSAQAVNDLAGKLSMLNAVDDETIEKGENILLTYTNIGKNVFPDATQAALDLSRRMGIDLTSAVNLVGKALNDPIQGVTALRRVGVQLSAQQLDQVKRFMAVNDVASAQKIILGELQKEMGGAGAAFASTAQGGIAKAEIALGNLKEAIGGLVLPVVGQLASLLADRLNDAVSLVSSGIDRLTDFFKPLQPVLQQIFDNAHDIWQLFSSNLSYSLRDVGTILGSIFQPNLKGAASTLSDFVFNVTKQAEPIVVALADAIGSLVKNGLLKLKEIMPDIRQHLHDFGDALGRLPLKQVGDFLKGAFKDGLQQADTQLRRVGTFIQGQLIPWLSQANDKFQLFKQWVSDQVTPALQRLQPQLEKIAPAVQKMLPALAFIAASGSVFGAIGATVATLGVALAQAAPYIQAIADKFQQLRGGSDGLDSKLAALETLFETRVVPALQKVRDALSQALPYVQKFAEDVETRLGPVLKNWGTILGAVVGNALGLVLNGLNALRIGWNLAWPQMSAVLAGVWEVIKGVVEVAWSIVSGIVKVGLDLLGGNFKQANADLLGIWNGLWDGVKHVLGGAWQIIQATVGNSIGQILGHIGDLKDQAIGRLTLLEVGGVALFDRLRSAAVGKVNDLKNGIISALQSLPGRLSSLGQQMINALADAIRNGAGKIAGAVSGVVNGALSHLPGGIHLPGFAAGTSSAPGGLALVGEGREAELVIGPHVMNLPRGSQVIPIRSGSAVSGGRSSGANGGSAQQHFHFAAGAIVIQGTNMSPAEIFDSFQEEARWRAMGHG
jgi:phage-related protein